MVADNLEGVLQLPAVAAVVLEAGEVPAEVGALLGAAGVAEGVLQVRVHLDVLAELRGFDLDEGGGDSLHVRLGVVESHPDIVDL